jgi:hypothetical protein
MWIGGIDGRRKALFAFWDVLKNKRLYDFACQPRRLGFDGFG